MRNLFDFFKLSEAPKEFSGLKKYYSRHKELPWGLKESEDYEIGLPPADVNSGYLKAPDKPHVYIIDELSIGEAVFADLIAVESHGYIRDGDWTVNNGGTDVDAVKLVKELYQYGHKVNILLMCASYDFVGSERIRDPDPNYYSFLNENGVVYSKPKNAVVPCLKVGQDGKVTGYLHDKNAFENLDKLKKK